MEKKNEIRHLAALTGIRATQSSILKMTDISSLVIQILTVLARRMSY